MFYISKTLLERELARAKEQKESFTVSFGDSANGDSDATISIAMLVFIALLVIIEIVLTVFAMIYTFRCHKAGKFPTWLVVLFVIFLLLPTPMQPLLALTLTIYGAVQKCHSG